MRRAKLDRFDTFFSLARQQSIQILIAIGLFFLLLVTVEIPLVFKTGFGLVSQESLSRPNRLQSKEEVEEKEAPSRPLKHISENSYQPTQSRPRDSNIISGFVLDPKTFNSIPSFISRRRLLGKWGRSSSGKVRIETKKVENRFESCQHSISLTGSEFAAHGTVMVMPCGLTLGSHITLVGRPRATHQEFDPKIPLVRDGEAVMVSQFKVELLGLKTVEGEGHQGFCISIQD